MSACNKEPKSPGPFSPSDLPIADGQVYHLHMAPEDLAQDILIVGDPGRARAIAKGFFHSTEFTAEHRGLYTATGTVHGQRITVTTSGMGTPSLEIVLGELYVLNAIDFATRMRKPDAPALNIIRIGTSGGLRAETELGTLVLTDIAVGLDNTGLFYAAPSDSELEKLSETAREVLKSCGGPDLIRPYCARADREVLSALQQACESRSFPCLTGITVSNSGFFGPQGRDILPMAIQFPNIDGAFAAAESGIPGRSFENMEMESSFLFHWAAGVRYRAGSICVAIANRRAESFDFDYERKVTNATAAALQALRKLRGYA